MKTLYEEYKDIAAFRIVYIREAHAADSHWPVPYAKEKGITEHKDYSDRCQVADMMMKEENVTIPCVIDHFDNQVNDAYQGWPTRLFLVRKDGRLGVAGGRGPWGLVPAMQEAEKWLVAYKETGKEPNFPETEVEETTAQSDEPVPESR